MQAEPVAPKAMLVIMPRKSTAGAKVEDDESYCGAVTCVVPVNVCVPYALVAFDWAVHRANVHATQESWLDGCSTSLFLAVQPCRGR